MSPSAARVAVLLLCLVAFGGRLLASLWTVPLSWRVDLFPLRLLIWLVPALISLGIPLFLHARFVAPLGRRTATFQVEETARRFVVRDSLHNAGLRAIIPIWILGGVVVIERVPGTDRARIAGPPDLIFSGVLVIVAFALIVVMLRVRRPTLTLEPAGITIQRFRRTVIGWDELLPGGPPDPVSRTAREVVLRFSEAPPPGRLPRIEQLPVGRLDVDPTFLTATVRHYVEAPDRRAAIGSADELARLRAELVTGPA